MTVTIEKRVTKNFQIDTQEFEDKLQDGFELEDTAVSPQEVEVTSGEQTMEEISRIIISSDLEAINEDVSDSFPLQAVDDNGDRLSASIEPKTVDVQLNVSAPDKEVSLEPAQTGEAADGVSGFDFQLNENNATISGAQNLLNEVDSLEVPVDVTDVTEPTTRNVNVQIPPQLSSDIDTVSVNITPIFEDSSEESGSSSTTDSQSSTQEQSNGENESQETEVEETEAESADPTRSPPAEQEETTTQESQEQTEETQETQDSADGQVDAQENEEETER